MEQAFESSQTNALMAAAGSPAGGVPTLDLSGAGEHITAGFAGTGANFAAGDLQTLNGANFTQGQLNDGTAGATQTTHGTTLMTNWLTTPQSSLLYLYAELLEPDHRVKAGLDRWCTGNRQNTHPFGE